MENHLIWQHWQAAVCLQNKSKLYYVNVAADEQLLCF